MRITKSSVSNGLIFFIGLFWFVHIRVVGDLFFSELALILIFLLMYKNHGYKLREPLPKKILLFGLLWLLGQVATDLIRMSPVDNLLKGWASIIFFLFDFSALYMLIYKSERKLMLLIIATALGSILKCFVDPGYGFDVEPWKFGFAIPTMVLTIISLSWALKKRLITLPMLALGLMLLGFVSIYLNSRSLGGSIILTGVILLLIRNRVFYMLLLNKMSLGKKLQLGMYGFMVIFFILSGYQVVGEARILPENSQAKYDLNASTSFGVFGMLLAGRNEFLASIPAVMDSPIIGHGSWAEDPKYRLFLYELNDMLGADRDEASLARAIEEKNAIPAHSHLMQSWVWAGVLGAIFWFTVLSFIGKSVLLSIRYQHVLTPLVIFMGITGMWDVLFSPFSSIMRFKWAWTLMLIIMSIEMAKDVAKARSEKRGSL